VTSPWWRTGEVRRLQTPRRLKMDETARKKSRPCSKNEPLQDQAQKLVDYYGAIFSKRRSPYSLVDTQKEWT